MRLLLVTGMHRSGTSLAARVLNLLGVDLGPTDAMLATTTANPRGYWEAEPITELDNDLLGHLGGSWRKLPPLPPGWEAEGSLDPFRRRARDLLAELFGAAEVAAFKDPRASVLLPFWRTVTPVAGTLLVLRSPQEVADSVQARDGHHPEHVAGLWLDYVTAAWIHDPDRKVVSYEQLLAAPVETAHRLADWFHLFPPTDTIARRIEDFRDPDLRRATGAASGQGPVMAAAATVYGILAPQGRDPLAEPAEGLDPLLRQWHADRALGRQLAVEAHRLRAVARERDRALGRIDQLERDRAAAQAVSDQRARERDDARRQADHWRDQHARLRQRRAVRVALAMAAPLRGVFARRQARRDD